MRNHHRIWLRLAAAILAAEGILTLMYGGFLPSPILPEIGVSVPIVGRLTVFWGVMAGADLVAAAGVASRRRWGRALAAVLAAVAVTFSGLSLVAALTHADPGAVPGGLVGIGLAGIVLYAVLRHWPAAGVRT
jgi:hypothetical protein